MSLVRGPGVDRRKTSIKVIQVKSFGYKCLVVKLQVENLCGEKLVKSLVKRSGHCLNLKASELLESGKLGSSGTAQSEGQITL
jgi:hypothetical protein